MQIQKQIGEGSFGKVYLAKWKETTVAVKILSSSTGSSDDDFPTRLPNPLLQSLEKVCTLYAFVMLYFTFWFRFGHFMKLALGAISVDPQIS